MSYQARERRERRRERVAISILSLLILFMLLGGYVALQMTQDDAGGLAVVQTSEVTVSVGEREAVPDPSPGAPTPEPTAAPRVSRPSGQRNGGLVTEVLGGANGPNAVASSGPSISTGAAANASGRSGAPAAVTTSTPAAGSTGTGLVPSFGASGSSSGSAGGDGTGPFDFDDFDFPPGSGGGGGNLPVPTATPGASGDSHGEATPLGHNSHLHIDGVVGPGAYTTGGILVSNTGPVAFNYSLHMTTAGDAAFAQVIRLRIYLRVGESCNYPGQPPSPSSGFLPLTGDQAGTVIYDGNFASGGKFGDPTVEVATGDRFLAIGESEVLCMEAFFPWTADNQYQGMSVNGTMIFTAKSPE